MKTDRELEREYNQKQDARKTVEYKVENIYNGKYLEPRKKIENKVNVIYGDWLDTQDVFA